MRVLLSGFEPFAGEPINPSWEIARSLRGRQIAGHRIHAVRLPVTFADSLPVLQRAIGRCRPSLVIALGQAGGRESIALERVAINIQDARIADNAGVQPIDRPIRARGPAAYFTRLPIKAIFTALETAGIPAEVSQSAGTFVCNHVFYGLMDALRRRPALRAGFIHVPYLPEQAARCGAPGLELAQMVAALRLAIATAVSTPTDAVRAAGREH